MCSVCCLRSIALLVAALAIFVGYLKARFPRTFVQDACGNRVPEGVKTVSGLHNRCGWQEIKPQVHVYLQPSGSWCWSNAAFDAKRKLLVDTLTDPVLTRSMLASLPGQLETLVYTHGDIDHVFGDQEVPAEVPRFARAELADEILGQAKKVTGLSAQIALARYVWRIAELYPWRDLVGVKFVGKAVWPAARAILGWAVINTAMSAFSFHEVDASKMVGVTHPIVSAETSVANASFHYIGPIHSKSDSVVLLHDEKVCFAGDLLFVGIAPIMWSGPAKAWVNGLDHLMKLTKNMGKDWLFVPGHGPVTDARGVQLVRSYFSYLDQAVSMCSVDDDDTACASSVLAGLPDILRESFHEPHRIIISARIERMARSSGGPVKVDMPTKVKFLVEQGSYMIDALVSAP